MQQVDSLHYPGRYRTLFHPNAGGSRWRWWCGKERDVILHFIHRQTFDVLIRWLLYTQSNSVGDSLDNKTWSWRYQSTTSRRTCASGTSARATKKRNSSRIQGRRKSERESTWRCRSWRKRFLTLPSEEVPTLGLAPSGPSVFFVHPMVRWSWNIPAAYRK